MLSIWAASLACMVWTCRCTMPCSTPLRGICRHPLPPPFVQACYEHDRCLEENRDLEASTYCAASGTPNCFCDSQLASKAWDVSMYLSG